MRLEAWHDFYLLVGTGGAALTGLLFVIVSLGPHVAAEEKKPGVRAFISPIAVHFTAALIVSALMLVPDIPLLALAVLLALGGFGGAVYTGWTRAHGQWRRSKLPVLDWIWFIGLPFVTFLLIFGSGIALAMHCALGLHGVAAATVSLIVIGIRNAWDIVLWVAQKPPS